MAKAPRVGIRFSDALQAKIDYWRGLDIDTPASELAQMVHKEFQQLNELLVIADREFPRDTSGLADDAGGKQPVSDGEVP